jgi:hypothetical protein
VSDHPEKIDGLKHMILKHVLEDCTRYVGDCKLGGTSFLGIREPLNRWLFQSPRIAQAVSESELSQKV